MANYFKLFDAFNFTKIFFFSFKTIYLILKIKIRKINILIKKYKSLSLILNVVDIKYFFYDQYKII